MTTISPASTRKTFLFISGTKDPFGSPDELMRWTSKIDAPVEHVWIEGGRRDLKGADTLIADAVARFIGRVIAR
jgi:predicted alpha/beta-hydrolase family hydrolase